MLMMSAAHPKNRTSGPSQEKLIDVKYGLMYTNSLLFTINIHILGDVSEIVNNNMFCRVASPFIVMVSK